MTFLLIIWSKILSIWNKLNWQPRVILGLILLILILSGLLYCGRSTTEVDQLKEQRSVEIRTEVNKLDTQLSNINKQKEDANIQYNISANKDSNKYSSNQTQTTNNFCSSMCKRKILDSTCQEWAIQNNTKCD